MERGSEPRGARRLVSAAGRDAASEPQLATRRTRIPRVREVSGLVVMAWVVLAIPLVVSFGVVPSLHAQASLGGSAEGDDLERGAFEPRGSFANPPEGDAPFEPNATEGETENADPRAPGLRRAGERSMRTRSFEGARSSTGGRVVKTLVWLVVVVGLAVGTLHLVRRFIPGSVAATNRNLIRVVGRGAIGPKQQVVVTQVAGQLLILGVTPDSITRLGQIEDPEQVARAVPAEETFAGRFASIEEVYGEDEDTSVSTAAWHPPEWEASSAGEVESRLEPYRREISRLQSMVETWQRDDSRNERGTA